LKTRKLLIAQKAQTAKTDENAQCGYAVDTQRRLDGFSGTGTIFQKYSANKQTS
jgi:hypothetical protein